MGLLCFFDYEFIVWTATNCKLQNIDIIFISVEFSPWQRLDFLRTFNFRQRRDLFPFSFIPNLSFRLGRDSAVLSKSWADALFPFSSSLSLLFTFSARSSFAKLS